VSGFKKFILRGNLVDLAVAVVIGAAFGAVVTSLVKDLITPLIAAIGGQQDFSKLAFTVNKSTFNYGDFINALLTFVIIAAVVYFFVVSPVARLLAFMQRKQDSGKGHPVHVLHGSGNAHRHPITQASGLGAGPGHSESGRI
jgi:large conductance mechanosensitive channel